MAERGLSNHNRGALAHHSTKKVIQIQRVPTKVYPGYTITIVRMFPIRLYIKQCISQRK